jgi:hypothetical protein
MPPPPLCCATPARPSPAGWGQSVDVAVDAAPALRNSVITWANGEVIGRFGPDGKHLPVIEHESASNDEEKDRDRI